MNILNPRLTFKITSELKFKGSSKKNQKKNLIRTTIPACRCIQLSLTIVEISLLVHHECLDFRAIVFAEGEGSGVFWSELIFPGASEVDGVNQGESSNAVEVLS